jgi:hypothetical protein
VRSTASTIGGSSGDPGAPWPPSAADPGVCP